LTAAANAGTLSEHELDEVRMLIEQRSGILFEGARERFFSSRVRDHLSAKRLAHGAELLRLIRSSNAEYDALLERLLTQETSFFRYPDVFAALKDHVLPDLHARKFWQNPRSLRIWSAGCATGEEPYSIAITLLDTLEFAEAWNLHILATDISRQALAQAERGVYRRRQLQALTPKQIDTYFTSGADQYAVKPRLRSLVAFAPMNLAQPTYLGRFDCIFCMNVLIYFSAERRAELIRRFYEYLQPGGYLFLGHAETANGAAVKFNTIIHRDARLYQKPLASIGTAAGGERP
jgi:chemotaxis protein methyltransferase CheR